jgi:NAD(P)H-hydrate epimerase
MLKIDSELVRSLCPERDENGHKGTFGTVLICAGSEFMTGAQTLATESALRSGVGMVRVFAPRESMVSTSINCPCAMFAPFEDTPEATVRAAKELLTKASAVLIGPGLDEKDKRSSHLLRFFMESAEHLVIDASALNILSANKAMLLPQLRKRPERHLAPAVLTPHIGEFRRLTGKDERKAAAEFSREYNCITVLKSASTYISICGKEDYTISSPNSGMGKGGSGDVLAGLLAGLISQGMSEEDAAVCAVYIHSAAGRVAAEELGKRVMLPSDLPSYFTDVFEEISWEAKGE